MAPTTPDWLARHGGELRAGIDDRSWIVHIDNKPQYLLTAVPVKGQHGCQVTQTINGRRLDRGAAYPTVEDAVHGGLEDLRQALGW